MVGKKYGLWCLLGAMTAFNAQAATNDEMMISQNVSAAACDDKKADDDARTAENRAVDRASLAAVKTSGVIQNKYPDLGPDALDVIAYRIIDEHLRNTISNITLNDDSRVCVTVNSRLELSTDELAELVAEYHRSEPSSAQIAAVAEKVRADTTLKPQSPEEKKLLFVDELEFYDGTKTNDYAELLTDAFSHSDYFYVTAERDIADFVIEPRLLRSVVDRIDDNHRKMQITVELEIVAPRASDFSNISVQQNNFMLFAADKDEQEIADSIVQKLLARSAEDVSQRLDKYSAQVLENEQIRGVK